jgi:tetratricopeptide (TPR) repeat protein
VHQRTQPGRGIGNGTLSSYYSSQSQAYAALKMTAEAVDAACGAIVSWGPRHEQRQYALQNLERVLRNAAGLEAYVKNLDRQAAESGLHNPIVRKALGKVYVEKNDLVRAVEQLQLACQLQPNDTETHEKLVECYDRMDDEQGAIRQLLQTIQLSRREIQLYKDLAQRYEKLGQDEQAERAHTSIVEALPNESEGHTMLAEIRQQQDRWDEAIVHWEEVARIRELEPTGLLKLAEAQVHVGHWKAADDTVRRLRQRTWPQRFRDVESRTRELERRIEAGRDVE